MKKVLRQVGLGRESLNLDAHDGKAEAEVEQIKRAYTSLTKALDEAHPHSTDPAKQLKRVPQHVVGTKMMAAAQENFEDTTSGFGKLYQSSARIQLDLGQMVANHHSTVHANVIDKLNEALEASSADVAAARKKVMAGTANFESCKKKYEQAKTKAEMKGGEESQQKCDAAKAAFDESVGELKKAQTGYSVSLRSFLDQDRQLGAPLVDLVAEQINYHRTSLMILEQMMPKLQSVYREMGSTEGRVFGGVLPPTGVPPVLLHCCACINREGLDEEGIFRRAGAASQIRNLREAFSKGTADLSKPANYAGDIHAVAAIIKAYFRELHEPLLITTFYNSWVEAVQIEDHNEKLYAMQNLATSMPRGHYDTLRFISKFCNNVATKADTNKMNLNNLALVFGPNMLWQAGQTPGDIGDDSQSVTVAAEMLFTYADWFFPPEEGEINALSTNVTEMIGGGDAPASASSPPVSPAPIAPSRTEGAAAAASPPPVPKSTKPTLTAEDGSTAAENPASPDGPSPDRLARPPRPGDVGASPIVSRPARPKSVSGGRPEPAARPTIPKPE